LPQAQHKAAHSCDTLRKIGCARMTVALPQLIFMLILRNVLRFTVPFAANYRATARWLNAKSTAIAPMLQAENRLSHCANTQDVSCYAKSTSSIQTKSQVLTFYDNLYLHNLRYQSLNLIVCLKFGFQLH
jgi:hypothetical protein